MELPKTQISCIDNSNRESINLTASYARNVSSSLEKKSLLRDNVDLLVSLADVYFRAGDTKNSILKFEQAQMLDPYLIKGAVSLSL